MWGESSEPRILIRQTTGGTVSTHAARPPVELAPDAPARPGLALALALIAIPGVTIAWDLSGIAGFAGTGVGIAAIVVGLQARSRLAGPRYPNGDRRRCGGHARSAVGRVLPDRRSARLMDPAVHPTRHRDHVTGAIEEDQRLAARRAAAAACRMASPLQATAAAPLWRALSDESAAWLLSLTGPRGEG